MRHTSEITIKIGSLLLMVFTIHTVAIGGSGRPDKNEGAARDTAAMDRGDTDIEMDTADTMDSDVEVDTADTMDSDVEMDTADTMDSDVEMDTADTMDSDVEVDTPDTTDSDIQMDTTEQGDPYQRWDSEEGWDPGAEPTPNGVGADEGVHMIWEKNSRAGLATKVGWGTDKAEEDAGQWDSDVEVDTADTSKKWDSDVEMDTADTGDTDIQMDTTEQWDSDVEMDTADTGDTDIQMDTTEQWDSDVEMDTADTGDTDIQMDTTEQWDSDVEMDTADTGDTDIQMDTTDTGDTDIQVGSQWEFDQWNNDGDSVVSRSEFMEGWRETDVVSKIDADGNDTITAQELASVLFVLWDTDTNGTIDSAEFKQAHRWYADSMDVGKLSYWDTNGDRELNENELASSIDPTLLEGVQGRDVENGITAEDFDFIAFMVADQDNNLQIEKKEWKTFSSAWDRITREGFGEEIVKRSGLTG